MCWARSRPDLQGGECLRVRIRKDTGCKHGVEMRSIGARSMPVRRGLKASLTAIRQWRRIRVWEVRVKGGGGIRKIRVAVGSRSKLGGDRVIYSWAVRFCCGSCVSDQRSADLTLKQVAQLAKAVSEEFRDEGESV